MRHRLAVPGGYRRADLEGGDRRQADDQRKRDQSA
jgi:hypothetical protein